MEQLGGNFLLDLIIRPPRNQYPDDSKDNNQVFEAFGKKFVKKVFSICNDKGEKLSCMLYEPEHRPADKMPVVIYMHGNAGCKLESQIYALPLLKEGINLCAFDFSGCGLSQGEWVTLGWKERHDLKSMVEYLLSAC